MTTIRDVAQGADASVAAVSHVINETRFASDALRQRVLTTMGRLGYQPNALACSLRHKPTHTLGMIPPDSANPFFAEIARSIERASFAQGYSTILCNSDGDLAKELFCTNVLLEKQVDGIVFVAAGMSAAHIQAILNREVPVVVIDRDLPGVEVDTVLCDHQGGSRVAVEHLIARGHRRIGCITGPSDVTPSAGRVEGYRSALAVHDLPVDEALIQRGDFQYAGGAEATVILLSFPEPPTAIFACNHTMAIGAISAATEMGRHVPVDLAIVGFDDVAQASFSNPPLTTVCQPKQQMGEVAIDLLLARIKVRIAPPSVASCRRN